MFKIMQFPCKTNFSKGCHSLLILSNTYWFFVLSKKSAVAFCNTIIHSASSPWKSFLNSNIQLYPVQLETLESLAIRFSMATWLRSLSTNQLETLQMFYLLLLFVWRVSPSLSLIMKPRKIKLSMTSKFTIDVWLKWLIWYCLCDKHCLCHCNIQKKTCLLTLGSKSFLNLF